MNNLHKNKHFLVIISIGALILVNFLSSKEKGGFLEQIKNKEIKSIIIKKYINEENHNIPFIVYYNDSLIVPRAWWDKISEGDSIIKQKESLELLIKSTNKVEVFHFQDNLGLEQREGNKISDEQKRKYTEKRKNQ